MRWEPSDVDMATWLDGLGERFALFDQQDSGCVSYGVRTSDGSRVFVKTSTTPAAVGSMTNALRFHDAVEHAAIVRPVGAYRFGDENVAIAYPWRDGSVLYPTTPAGSAVRVNPTGPMVRFRALDTDRIRDALDTILDAHIAVRTAGFVAVDLYDGCFLYDFDMHSVCLVDLDEYRPGPFTLDADRLPGSTRFMAPEEFTRGATIDERTTVYTLGRTLRLLLDGGDAEGDWRGNDKELAAIAAATDPDPARRLQTVPELVEAWHASRV